MALAGLSAAFYIASRGSDTAPMVIAAAAFVAAGIVGLRWLALLVPVVIAMATPY